jgi:hypothetical protein
MKKSDKQVEECPRCGKTEFVRYAGLLGKKIGELWCSRPYGCGKRWIPGVGEYPYKDTNGA